MVEDSFLVASLCNPQHVQLVFSQVASLMELCHTIDMKVSGEVAKI